MTKIIAWCELRYLTLAELEALFRTLQMKLGRTAPGSRRRGFGGAPLEKSVGQGGAAVSRTEVAWSGKPDARVQGVSGTAPRGGLPPPVCPPADLRRRPGATGCPRSSSGI